MTTFLATSNSQLDHKRLSSSDQGSDQRRLSSSYSRQEKFEETDDAGKRSYDYIRLKSGRFNPRTSFYNDVNETRPWQCGEKYQHDSIESADSWRKCHRLVKKYDEEMCDAWREEVDKLLIFAGLFSATVTAFTIESYQWLQEDSFDTTSQYLAFLASEYARSQNTTLPPFLSSLSQLQQQQQATSAEVRINSFWFLSLTLSLTTVLIGILCLQWLREFQRDAALPHKEAIALRQMRFKGLLRWHVPTILSALPLLLQLSLLLFFAGLLDLLWNRNHIVAAFITVAVGLVVLFLGTTTILPALQYAFTWDEYLRVAQCPYKSPQSWLFMRVTQWWFWAAQILCSSWTSESLDWPSFHRLLKSVTDLDWMMFDMRWRRHRDAFDVAWGTPKGTRDSEDIVGAMQWINDTFTSASDTVYHIYHCLADLDIPAASNLISFLYQGTPFEDTTFRVMMDDRYSPDVVQKREIISTFYLHVHQDKHPIIKPLYVESVVRILNSQEVPQPFLDWLSTILQEISSHLISMQTPNLWTGIADPQLLGQAISCVGSLAARDSRRNIDIIFAWVLLEKLLWGIHKNPEELVSPENINTQHVKLACAMFRDLGDWITKNTRELELKGRVDVCMEGLMLLFPPHLTRSDILQLYSGYPEFRNALHLVDILDKTLPQLVADTVEWPSHKSESWRSLVAKFQPPSN